MDISGVDVIVNYKGLGGNYIFNYGYLDVVDGVMGLCLVRCVKN